jgi:hypothetical protein
LVVRTRHYVTVVALLSGLSILVTPSVAGAEVSITVPGSVGLGSAATGTGMLSAQLGTVTVTARGVLGVVLPSFTATVSSTDFTTGVGTTAETVPKASVSYWSGPLTASTGAQTAVPGQLTALQALPMSAPRIAFSSSGTVLTITTSWNPTIVVSIPPAAVAGTYTGTITHSVA